MSEIKAVVSQPGMTRRERETNQQTSICHIFSFLVAIVIVFIFYKNYNILCKLTVQMDLMT